MKIDIEYFFRINLKLLWILGFKCSFNKKDTKFTFMHKLPTYMINVLGIIMFILEVCFILDVRRSNIALTIQAFTQSIANLQCMCKGFLTANATNKIQKLFEQLGIIWKQHRPMEDRHALILSKAYNTLSVCKLYYLSCILCIIFFNGAHFVSFFFQYLNREATNHTYDFSQRSFLAKYPFEIRNIPTYMLFNILELFLGTASGLFWVSIDALFAQITTHICIQFRILKYDTEVAFNSECTQELSSLINLANRHQELLRICNLTEEIFSSVIFSTMLLSASSMCFNVVGVRKALSSGYYDGLGSNIFLFINTFLQILFYCVFAETLTKETISLADSVYNLKWTTKDYKLRYYIQFIISRSQKAFYCTACGFFPIGHRQLSSIINTSFSYYMMLQTMSN